MRIGPVILAAALVAASGSGAKSHKPRNEVATIALVVAGDANGAWSVISTTSVGNCPALIPDLVTISDNKVASTSSAQIAPWGYVDEDGTIVARFTAEGGRVARFHGQLRGAKGSGAWLSSTDMCGGTWRAVRGGAESAAQ